LKDSIKVIVVLGHSKCGAVTAAVDTHMSPSAYVNIAATYPLRSLVDQIQIAVRGSANALEQYMGMALPNKSLYRSLLVGVAAYVNAAVSAFELQREMGLYSDEGPQVVFGIYDFESLRVQSSPSLASASPRLRPAPRTADELANYAIEVVQDLASLEDDERDAGYMLTVRA
jgi:carbonic anhydrase